MSRSADSLHALLVVACFSRHPEALAWAEDRLQLAYGPIQLRSADYEAYLAQYPEGNFASLARARLAELIESAGAARDPADREVELAFWDSVRELDNAESVQAYLDKYPTGEFVANLEEVRLPRAMLVLIPYTH